MTCPTCSKTLARVAEQLWHCGTCGSLVGCYPDGAAVVPSLVRRCRDFAALPSVMDEAAWHDWRRLGIDDAIRSEAERKEHRQ